MRCNRKTSGFAVTPHRKVAGRLDITAIWQLRRHESVKTEVAVFKKAFILRGLFSRKSKPFLIFKDKKHATPFKKF